MKIEVTKEKKVDNSLSLDEMLEEVGLFVPKGFDCYVLCTESDSFYIDPEEGTLEQLDNIAWASHRFIRSNDKIVITLGG